MPNIYRQIYIFNYACKLYVCLCLSFIIIFRFRVIKFFTRLSRKIFKTITIQPVITVKDVHDQLFKLLNTTKYLEDITNLSEDIKEASRQPVVSHIIQQVRQTSLNKLNNLSKKIESQDINSKSYVELTLKYKHEKEQLEENRKMYDQYKHREDFCEFANLLVKFVDPNSVEAGAKSPEELPHDWKSYENETKEGTKRTVYWNDQSVQQGSDDTTYLHPNIYYFDLEKAKSLAEKSGTSLVKSTPNRTRQNSRTQNTPIRDASPENTHPISPANEEEGENAYELLTEAERRTLFFSHPEALDIIRQNYPNFDRPAQASLRKAVDKIRKHGLAGYQDVINDENIAFSFALMMSSIDEVMRSMDLFYQTSTERPLARPLQSGRKNTLTKSNSSELQRKQKEFYTKLKELGYAQSNLKLCLQNVPRKNIANAVRGAINKAKPVILQKCKMQIQFENEEGLDFSGPLREMFHLVSKETFDPYKELFEYCSDSQYTVQVASQVLMKGALIDKTKQWFKFSGRLIGLALLLERVLGFATL